LLSGKLGVDGFGDVGEDVAGLLTTGLDDFDQPTRQKLKRASDTVIPKTLAAVVCLISTHVDIVFNESIGISPWNSATAHTTIAFQMLSSILKQPCGNNT
jgi:hypothetical protein